MRIIFNEMKKIWNWKLLAAIAAVSAGEWVVTAIILMYALTLGMSMFAFILSRFSMNLVTLIMKLVPAFTASIFLCSGVFNTMFGINNILYRLLQVFGTEAYVCVILFVLAIAAAWSVLRREKRVDVI